MSEFFTPLHVMFYLFAAIAIGAAVSVITARHPIHSVLSLVVTFFAMAGIWMMLRAEFLSLILLLVYVGAVMTLFLFVVMMLNLDLVAKRAGFVRYLPFGIFVVLLMTGLIILTVGPSHFGLTIMPAPIAEQANDSNTHALGAVLYTEYAYPFEVAGVLLLAAIIAAITLTYRGPIHRRVQDPGKQTLVQPQDRLRIIKMPSEKKQDQPRELPDA